MTVVAYGDASALVKRYLTEPGTDAVDAIEGWVTSTLSAVEVASAIWRRNRMRELSSADAALLARRAASDLAGDDHRTILVPPLEVVLTTAVRLTATAGLRGYDAVQLATAMAARDSYPDLNLFASFDEQLSGAAAAHGFELLPAP